MDVPDAVVVGSGPNGLAAAIVLAQAGRSVTVYEAAPAIGGGVRSAELTLPGFVHDICSAVHPFARASPFFRTLPLAAHGLQWTEPPVMLAHPFEDGGCAAVHRSVERTAEGLGADARRYRDLVGATVDDWPDLEPAVLGPLRWPRHPLTLARFGWQAIRPADAFARDAFDDSRTRALFAGMAAHGMLPLDRRPTAGIGLVLATLAHAAGWVFPRGGAQRLSDALAAHLRALGGEIIVGHQVRSLDELPPARAVLCDLSPAPFLRVAGRRLPPRYRRRLERYRYGMGAFKIDWALDGPIPWRAEPCLRAGTVHLGATFEQIARSEAAAWRGEIADRPFVILAQPTLFDPSRAPDRRQTAWAYCHVPRGSGADMLSPIERQIERFAPGFRERVLARAVMGPAEIERHNPNLVGGDIGAGVTDLRQLFTRPTWRTYSTPVRGLYLCSAATPPGVGVHGMCGYFAARRALRDLFGGER
ncbi:MAG: NAD(P)/FAD-dependent oxidoreductase [Acidobacteria bacterium]|nr:NAD(P)/FAD-dependent oxidoreductase [Acidobacteriota bacterium]